MTVARNRTHWPRIPGILILVLWLSGSEAEGRVGYGYKRGEDPLVLGVKRIVLHARRAEWPSAHKEFKRLGWQFKELRQELRIDIEPAFEKAIAAESMRELSREISRLLYHAIRQKFHWNQVEKCEKYVPAKSRVDAALYYYEEILSIGVRDHDRRTRAGDPAAKSGATSEIHEEILAHFAKLKKSIGSAGLFGIGARTPDLKTFSKRSRQVLEALETVYPFVLPRSEKKPRSRGPRQNGREGASDG